jgi:hypothetical protein
LPLGEVCQGDFEQLLIVRIDENFEFTGKLFEREELSGGGGKFLRARMLDADPPPETTDSIQRTKGR